MGDHRFFTFGKGKISHLASASDAVASLRHEDYAWFDFYNPKREELGALVEPLGLSPYSIEDALDEDQIPKIEDFPGYTFMLMNGYRYEKKELTVQEFDFFLGKNFLVTVHGGDGVRAFGAKLDEQIVSDYANVKRGPDFLCHMLLDYIVDHKFAVIESLQEELDLAEESIVESILKFKPEELLRLRRRLLVVRKSLVHEREVLVKICRKDSPYISEKGIYNYRDIYDHLVRFFESTEICREMISNLMEMYLSMLNNRMTLVSNQTNIAVKRLTLITTIFMPLTLLAGVFGMSEWSMMTGGGEHWRVTYPVFFLLMAVIAAGNFYLLKWLDRRRLSQAELVGEPEESPLSRESSGGA